MIKDFDYTVETPYNTIGGVQEIRSCYKRIVIKYRDRGIFFTIVVEWQKRVMWALLKICDEKRPPQIVVQCLYCRITGIIL